MVEKLESIIVSLNSKISKLEKEKKELIEKLEETQDMLATSKEYIQELTTMFLNEKNDAVLKVEEDFFSSTRSYRTCSSVLSKL